MVKEELEKEADDYADKHAFRVPYDGSNKFYDDVDFKASKEGYLAGAEPREKQIVELKAEIQNLEGIKLAQETALSKEYLIEEQLRKENVELKERYYIVDNAFKRKSEAEWRLNDLYQKVLTDFANAEKCSREYLSRYITATELLKMVLDWQCGNGHPTWKEVCAKIEQFLNSEVEK